MIMVFAMIGAIWGIGAAMKAPRRDRWVMTGVILAVVIVLHLTLPVDHPIRLNTGGSAALWGLIAAFGGLVYLYRLGLRRLRTRATAQTDETPAQPTGTFQDAELERYARHIVLREIGGSGQKALKQSRVLVIGAGGLGSPAAFYLAASGVGMIGIIDDDVVEASNLQRQIIHTDDAIGTPKVQSAADRIAALNPFVETQVYNRRLTEHMARDLVSDFDLVLDGTDNFDTRQIANRAAVSAGIPLVSGALGSWDGQITVFDPSKGGGCYQCLFPDAPDDQINASCAATGVAAPLTGIIGSLMAAEAVKIITGAGEPLIGRMMMFDALYADARTLTLKANPDCPTCGPFQKKD